MSRFPYLITAAKTNRDFDVGTHNPARTEKHDQT